VFKAAGYARTAQQHDRQHTASVYRCRENSTGINNHSSELNFNSGPTTAFLANRTAAMQHV